MADMSDTEVRFYRPCSIFSANLIKLIIRMFNFSSG